MWTTSSLVWLVHRIFCVATAEDIFNILPTALTTFSCNGREAGYYANIESDCRVYHTCDNHGNKFTYYCPQNTAFRQEALVCDHDYLVDCNQSAKLIARIPEDLVNNSNEFSTHFETSPSSGTYSRSYRINVQPSLAFSAPNQRVKDTTFVMRSTVFLRDHSHSRLNAQFLRNSQNSTSSEIQQNNFPSTIFQQAFNHNLTGMTSDLVTPEKFENLFSNMDTISSDNVKYNGQKYTGPRTSVQHKSDCTYSETLKLIQRKFSGGHTSTTSKTRITATAFPIPILIGMLAKMNNPDDDPYYPPGRMNTETYFTWISKNKNRKFFDSSTRRPWQKELKIKIPNVLPDLNSLDDLVDRRKHLYINKIKKNISV